MVSRADTCGWLPEVLNARHGRQTDRTALPAGLEIGQHVLEFAAAIPDFPEQPDEDGFLHFPVPVLFLEGSSVMLVREVYQELWEHIANSTLKGFVVSGSEDTGKSWWLLWVLIK